MGKGKREGWAGREEEGRREGMEEGRGKGERGNGSNGTGYAWAP